MIKKILLGIPIDFKILTAILNLAFIFKFDDLRQNINNFIVSLLSIDWFQNVASLF